MSAFRDTRSADAVRAATAPTDVGLIGDIGATNARFALVLPDGRTTPARISSLNDYDSLQAAIDAYLAEQSPGVRPIEAVLAIASPITGDEITLTNHAWTFSTEELRGHLGLRRLHIVNDFAANAAAIPLLGPHDRVQIGGGAPVPGAPAGIIGPGTGLGVGALAPGLGGAVTIAAEGGHVTMTPATAQESAILDVMRGRYDHVSAERVLSGPGLVNLYNTLCELTDTPAAPYTPDQITSPRMWERDPLTREATTFFCAMLGTVAGNLALTLGARGGIYIAGGIVPKLGDFFAQSEFRSRFESKGRMRGYVAAIPTYVIVRPYPGLLGAAALLTETCFAPVPTG
jgi:glucokinase